MQIRTMIFALAAAAAGCAASQPSPQSAAPEPATPDSSHRGAVSKEQCESQGGAVVGDIGDGATQRPNYVCPSGKPPLGNIAPPAGGPIAVEGSVCCPASR